MFRHAISIIVVMAVVASFALVGTKPSEPKAECLTIYFSPNGGAAAAVVTEIEAAKSSLDVAAYTITHPDISRAIIHAHNRGVKVRIVMDPTQTGAKYSAATPLMNAGIVVHVERGAGLLHHKMAIIDGAVVLTGSMNWSRAGDESNDEDLVIIRNADTAKMYAAHFENLLSVAQKWEPKH